MMFARIVAALQVLVLSTSIVSADGPLARICVSDDRTHFVNSESDQTFRPMGFNYDHDADGRLIEDYWHTEWERVENDFHDMQKLGANVVRIHLQFGRFMKSASEASDLELKQLSRLLTLAEDSGLYVDLTGLGCYHKKDVPDWYDSLDEKDRWKAQQVFWEAVAKTCKESSAVFCYNLMNEPVIGGENAAGEWLGPAFAGKHFVQFVCRQTNGRIRSDVAMQWIDQLSTAVRKIDDHHMITVGFVDWSLNRPGLTSGFEPDKVAKNLDFLAVHLYPKTGKQDDDLKTLEGFRIGKPVIIEETFPLGCSIDELEAFMDQCGDNSNGWISFYWGRMPQEYEPHQTIADAVTSQWIERFSIRMKGISR